MSLRITVVGSGYVGLVSGACLAARGHSVLCVDMKADVVESLNRGVPHFYEPGLGDLLTSVRNQGTFKATTSLQEAVRASDIVMIAVGTPSEQGKIDLAQVRAATEAVGAGLAGCNRFVAVVVKSTVLPGTTDTQVREWLEKSSGLRLGEFGL